MMKLLTKPFKAAVIGLLMVAVIGLPGILYAAHPQKLTYQAVSNPNQLRRYLSDPIFPGTVRYEGTVSFGVDGTGEDVYFYADTASDYLLWDQSADELLGVGVDIQLDDDSDLIFGTGDDWVVDSDTAKTLDLVPATTDETSVINVGADTLGADLKLFGATTAEYFSWDASADSVIGDMGNFSITTNDAEVSQFYFDAIGAVANAGQTGAFTFTTTDGGFYFDANGASNGDIALDAADDMTLTAAGDLTLAVTGTVSAGGSAITNSLRPVEVVTATPEAITAAESGKVFVSNYTGTLEFDLPDAAAGLYFTFTDNSATAANDVVIDPQAGDNINGDTNGDAIECTQDALGQTITLMSIDGTRWITVAEDGTWAAQ